MKRQSSRKGGILAHISRVLAYNVARHIQSISASQKHRVVVVVWISEKRLLTRFSRGESAPGLGRSKPLTLSVSRQWVVSEEENILITRIAAGKEILHMVLIFKGIFKKNRELFPLLTLQSPLHTLRHFTFSYLLLATLSYFSTICSCIIPISLNTFHTDFIPD